MPSPTDEEFTQSIVGCARCWGAGHDDLVFRKFTHPVESFNRADGVFEVMATHWSTCPTTGEPILMTFVEDEIIAAAMKEAEDAQ